MKRFMLIIREDLKKIGGGTLEDRTSNIPEMLKWVESIAESGNYHGGEPLETIGRYVTKDAVLSDGPFIESKEGISGYTAITVENMEQAVAFAQLCPLVLRGEAVIEVRPFLEVPDYLVFKWKQQDQ